MLTKIIAAWALMASCVVVHAFGVTSALRWTGPRPAIARQFMRWSWLFIRLAAWIIFLHLVEIAIWAVFYWWTKAMPDIQSAVYFSSATYTTTGYGDLVLQPHWRLLAGIEALTGILMAGWSTGFFFAFVSRMIDAERTAAPS